MSQTTSQDEPDQPDRQIKLASPSTPHEQNHVPRNQDPPPRPRSPRSIALAFLEQVRRDGPITNSAEWEHAPATASKQEKRITNNLELQAQELYEIKLLLASHLMVKASEVGGHQKTGSKDGSQDQVVQGRPGA